MLLLIDNFDSFTYNLVQVFQKIGIEVQVVRNTATVQECVKLKPDYLVIGPGPGTPHDSGVSIPLIKELAGQIPILGVCLGLQCIAELYGATVKRSELGPVHGKTSQIFHNNSGLFKDISQGFHATRYHSLVVDRQTVPDTLEVCAETAEGEIMGLSHRALSIEGVQFHPESVLTLEGKKMLHSFLSTTINLDFAKFSGSASREVCSLAY